MLSGKVQIKRVCAMSRRRAFREIFLPELAVIIMKAAEFETCAPNRPHDAEHLLRAVGRNAGAVHSREREVRPVIGTQPYIVEFVIIQPC